MLLEVAYKIVALILLYRVQPIEEELDHESQCGFRPGRGCTDAVFTLKQALRKRHEHGLSTWVFFMDLVKAFDRVPRELLWKILLKFGVPEKIVHQLKCLHERVSVKFTVDGVTPELPSIIGVKQGGYHWSSALSVLYRSSNDNVEKVLQWILLHFSLET